MIEIHFKTSFDGDSRTDHVLQKDLREYPGVPRKYDTVQYTIGEDPPYKKYRVVDIVWQKHRVLVEAIRHGEWHED